jgi:hypothetical protein
MGRLPMLPQTVIPSLEHPASLFGGTPGKDTVQWRKKVAVAGSAR